MKKRLFLAAFASAAALITAVPSAMAEDHMASEAAKSDIVDTAIAAGMFKTLVAAVQAAGLEGTLRSDGPFTVFAPTDDAFKALGDATIADLLKEENKEKLAGILTYHVVAGKTMSKDLAGKTLDVATVNGASVAIDATDGVTVGGANVVKADVLTTNGVIHVIDKVILPPAAE
ncbi:MAG: fasciclin domain-containing protein [Pseudomonadota bacterium]